MNDYDDIQDLITAYALGSIEEEDKARLEQLLAEETDGALAWEVADFSAAADLMALGSPEIEPSPDMRSKLFARIGESEPTLQTTPVSRPTGSPKRERKVGVSREEAGTASSWSWQDLFRPSPGLRLATGFAMILLLLATGFLWNSNQQLQGEIANLESNRGLETFELASTSTDSDRTGLVIMGANGQNGAFVVDNLDILDDSQQYQIWLIDPNENIVPGPVFSVNENGYSTGWIRANDALSSFSQFALTIEPSGGSPAPTSDILLLGQGASR